MASPTVLSEDQPLRTDSAARPIAEAVGDLFQVEEYPLTIALAAQLGLKQLIWREPEQEAVPLPTRLKDVAGIRYLITTHDDCFGYIYPQSLRLVIALHNTNPPNIAAVAHRVVSPL